MTIRQIDFASRSSVALTDATIEAAKENELLVRAEYTVISPGTELAFLQGAPGTPLTYPFHPGYTGVGVVEQVGPAVKAFKTGDRVAGWLRHASHSILNAGECVHLREGEARAYAGWHLASIALQGVRKIRVELGETVAVLGLGVIGNLAAQCARAAGATFVAGIDPIEWRQRACRVDACAADFETARKAGPQRVRDHGFDVVIEATGVANVIKTAFAAARRLGRVVLLGSTRGETDGVDFYTDVHKKGLTIVGAHGPIRADAQDTPGFFTAKTDQLTCIELISSGRIDVDSLVSAWVSPSEAPRAYQRLVDREKGLMTIGFDWR